MLDYPKTVNRFLAWFRLIVEQISEPCYRGRSGLRQGNKVGKILHKRAKAVGKLLFFDNKNDTALYWPFGG